MEQGPYQISRWIDSSSLVKLHSTLFSTLVKPATTCHNMVEISPKLLNLRTEPGANWKTPSKSWHADKSNPVALGLKLVEAKMTKHEFS